MDVVVVVEVVDKDKVIMIEGCCEDSKSSLTSAEQRTHPPEWMALWGAALASLDQWS
jgi:hypothetical protein